MKRILNSRPVQILLCNLIGLYIWLVHKTSRWQVVGGDTLNHFLKQKKPVIAAAWHGRIGMLAYTVPTPQVVRVLVSNHRDGELIAGVIKLFGYKSIRGSTRDEAKPKQKGGMKALRLMTRAITEGHTIFITPDGPRGPRMRASQGIIKLAQLTGVPILPFSYSMRHRRVAHSWDKFIIPRPFSRGIFVWGEPIYVPRDADDAALAGLRRRVEDELNAITRKADEMVGQEPIEPAPLPEVPGSI